MATAVDFAKAGFTVIATMRDPEGSPKLGEIASKSDLPIHIRTLDVNSGSSVIECFESVYEEFGSIDCLINNAGIEKHGSVEEMPIEEFKQVMDTNYFGVVRCVKEVMPHMRKAQSGCIINVTSVAGRISNPPLGPYSASKFALEAISEHLAIEAKPFGIKVYVVQPGIIDTPMARGISSAGESIYPYARRMAGLFEASLQNPVSPDIVAEKMRWLVEEEPETFRHPVGPDAEPYLGWRASLSDEAWIDWLSADDDTWFDQIQNNFGYDVRSILADRGGHPA
mgnify:CR=1 FL=1